MYLENLKTLKFLGHSLLAVPDKVVIHPFRYKSEDEYPCLMRSHDMNSKTF